MGRKKKSEKLNKVIKLDRLMDADPEAAAQYIFSQHMKKLAILMNELNINPYDETCWFQLAYTLANKYVPGFEFEVAKVKKNDTWNGVNGSNFYFNIEEIRHKDNCTIDKAINKYIEINNLNIDENNDVFDNLKRRYFEIKELAFKNNHILSCLFDHVRQYNPNIETSNDMSKFLWEEFQKAKERKNNYFFSTEVADILK